MLRIPGRPDMAIEFVVDTGFAGYLTLPIAAVQALALPQVREIAANRADNSTIVVNVHESTVLWHGAERVVEVLAMGKHSLLGMLLLDGSEMNIQFADGGLVSLEEL
ncbi:MAG: clan AA aspartic protease [Fibrella sp.]|nr:clan AA aspartic protease [Armatimonadota bacterium]